MSGDRDDSALPFFHHDAVAAREHAHNLADTFTVGRGMPVPLDRDFEGVDHVGVALGAVHTVAIP